MAINEPLIESTKPILKGGRRTSPFIVAGVVGVGIGAYSVTANIAVYLIDKYNIPPVDGSVIASVVAGATNLAPIFGAIISDTCLGCFTVIVAAIVANSLAMILFTSTAAFPFLRPGTSESPKTWHYGVLYTAIGLMTIGLGGTRFTAATMGAAQLDDQSEQDNFFSWYVVGLYVSSVIGITGIVYIQQIVGWTFGFGLCSTICIIGLIIFLLGNRYYRHPKPQKNPFVDIWSSIVRRLKWKPSEDKGGYDNLTDGLTLQITTECTSSSNEEISVGEEDLITLLKLVPLITTGIILSLYLAIQMNITFIQALVMDRNLGNHFAIPAGSMAVFILVAATIAIPLLDTVIYPAIRYVFGKPLTPLQRVGLGFLITTLAMVYGAIIEHKRLEALKTSSDPWSVLWLVPCLMLVGVGEALHFPGQLAFFYQEFPESLKSSGTAVSSIQSGFGSFMTSPIVLGIQRFLGWIQNNANDSRLDYVYWILAATGVLNFGAFLLCSKFYKQKGAKI